MRFIHSALSMTLAVIVLSGCASTKFQVSGQTPQQPLCQRPGDQSPVLVVWAPKWRSNQKQPLKREAIAQRGIESFFSTSECFANAKVIRNVSSESTVLSPSELRTLIAAETTAPNLVLFITVREFGPILKLLSFPVLVEGATDVFLEIRAVSPSTGQTIADFTAHWQNGGPYFIKGIATLEQDIGSTLREALKQSDSRK